VQHCTSEAHGDIEVRTVGRIVGEVKSSLKISRNTQFQCLGKIYKMKNELTCIILIQMFSNLRCKNRAEFSAMKKLVHKMRDILGY
jgi:hypothetical protein